MGMNSGVGVQRVQNPEWAGGVLMMLATAVGRS